MMINVRCADCPYCQFTNIFYIRWCSYWQKIVYLTDGCTREDG